LTLQVIDSAATWQDHAIISCNHMWTRDTTSPTIRGVLSVASRTCSANLSTQPWPAHPPAPRSPPSPPWASRHL